MKKIIFVLLLILIFVFPWCTALVNYKESEVFLQESPDPPTTSYTASEEIEISYQYIGNINSMIFHHPHCHTLPYERNRVYFVVRSKAIEQGYKPCENCNP